MGKTSRSLQQRGHTCQVSGELTVEEEALVCPVRQGGILQAGVCSHLLVALLGQAHIGLVREEEALAGTIGCHCKSQQPCIPAQ